MKLLDSLRLYWHFEYKTKHRLPSTNILGIPYQPDWTDVLGLFVVGLPIVLLSLALAIR